MKYQKSPLPYLTLLFMIIGVAVYSTSTIDRQIDAPLVYTIDNVNENKLLAGSAEKEGPINHTLFIACINR